VQLFFLLIALVSNHYVQNFIQKFDSLEIQRLQKAFHKNSGKNGQPWFSIWSHWV